MLLSDLKERILFHTLQDLEIDRSKLKIFKNKSKTDRCFGDLILFLSFQNKSFNGINNEDYVKNLNNLLNNSKYWPIPVETFDIKSEFCTFHIKKSVAVQNIINEVLRNSLYGKITINKSFNVLFPSHCIKNLTSWRRKLIAETLYNVIHFGLKDSFVNQKNNIINLIFLRKEFSTEPVPNSVFIRCETVTNLLGKETDLDYDEYLCLRKRDLKHLSFHKCGVDDEIDDYSNRLVEAVVKFDLLEVSPKNPIRIIEGSHGSSKGASFILYNCARIEKILRTFASKVATEFYEELPKLSDVNMKYLKEEEEWQLVFNYILPFPEMISKIIQNLIIGNCKTHLIPQYLSGLASLFSVYYRRVRILVDGRNHLCDEVFARIYLLKCIQKIFLICLKLLNIEPFNKM